MDLFNNGVLLEWGFVPTPSTATGFTVKLPLAQTVNNAPLLTRIYDSASIQLNSPAVRTYSLTDFTANIITNTSSLSWMLITQ